MKDDLVNKSGDLVNDLVNDTISRAVAISKVKKLCEGCYLSEHCGKCLTKCLVRKSINQLKKVPPSQPSATDTNVGGTDTISRQAAIKAICEDGTMLERQGKYTMTMAERKQRDVDILDTLPPAQLAQDLPKGCTDTISRQAVIDALPYLLDYEGFKGESGYVSKNLVRTMLKGLPPVTPKQPGWIPCSERLPGKDESFYVLCCDKYGEIMIGNVFECYDGETPYSAESENEYMYDCVAWMPLPTPYREGGQS